MKISEMMNHISDDTVRITSNEPVSDERIKEAVMKKIQEEQNSGQSPYQVPTRRRPRRFVAGIVAAVLAVSMLGTTALAASTGINVVELVGRFFIITEDQGPQEFSAGSFYYEDEESDPADTGSTDPADISAEGEVESAGDNYVN